MPKRPPELPPELRCRPFTTAEARRAHVGRGRLERKDLVNGRHGVWVSAGLDVSDLEVLGALVNEINGGFLSHVSAAFLYNIPVPYRLQKQLHVTRPRGLRAPQLAGVIGHQRGVAEGEIVRFQGLRISSPERLMFEMGQLVSADELVVIGDALVRIPRSKLETQTRPWTTLERLAAVPTLHPHSPGTRKFLGALPRVRIGADSPPETLCRLAIIRAGLPEPELQGRLDPRNRFSREADLVFREPRIAVQYDGGVHFDAESQAADVQRDAEWERAGWKVITVNRTDLGNGFAFLIAELHRLLD